MSHSSIKSYLTLWFSKIVLKTSPPEIKSTFRNIEKLKHKIIRLQCHRSFNETCLLNGLLPTYTKEEMCICRAIVKVFNTLAEIST